MFYFGTASGPRVCDAMDVGLLGQIVTPAAGNRVRKGVEWVADNGIYSNAYPGNDGYLGWLEQRAEHRALCRFAVAPDVVADHDATMARSAPMLEPIRATVGAVAVCAQNGATPANLPWGSFDALFLAGIVECVRCGRVPALSELPLTQCTCGGLMREWKLGPAAAAVTREARRRGVWVHMGRVNSFRRLQHAAAIGCHSADGTYLAFGPDKNLDLLLGWLDEIANQLPWGVVQHDEETEK